VNLDFDAGVIEFRAEVAAWLAAHVPADPVKHQLADVLIGLEFARPLLYAAAVALAVDSSTARRDVSAARVACADAAHRAARAGLQVHGAIGYTAEHDASLWLAKIEALRRAWGSQAWHRARVLAALCDRGAACG